MPNMNLHIPDTKSPLFDPCSALKSESIAKQQVLSHCLRVSHCMHGMFVPLQKWNQHPHHLTLSQDQVARMGYHGVYLQRQNESIRGGARSNRARGIYLVHSVQECFSSLLCTIYRQTSHCWSDHTDKIKIEFDWNDSGWEYLEVWSWLIWHKVSYQGCRKCREWEMKGDGMQTRCEQATTIWNV